MDTEYYSQLKELGLSSQEIATMFITTFIISSIITIGLFVLKAIAIRTMAKNKGLDKLYLAWIPFFNYILLGKVVGTCFLFRKKVNNIGLLVTIFSLIGFVMSTLLKVGYYINEVGYLFLGIENITKIITDSSFVYNWLNGQGLFYMISKYAYRYVVSILEIILKTTLIVFVFRKYAPERSFIYMLVSIFFDFMFGVLLFVIRNRKVVSYDDFLRMRVKTDYNYYNVNNQYNKNPENDPFPEFKSNNEQKTSDNDDLFN